RAQQACCCILPGTKRDRPAAKPFDLGTARLPLQLGLCSPSAMAKKKVRKRVKTTKKSAPRKASAKPKKKPAPKPKAKAKAKAKTKTKGIPLADAIWQSGTHAEEIGELEIPSGKVKVSDAGTLFAPVEVAIPKGTYHVRITRNDDGENRAAVLIKKGAVPVTWFDKGSYAVDAGMSGFFDGVVFARVDKHVWPI